MAVEPVQDDHHDERRKHNRNVALSVFLILFLLIGLIWFFYWLLVGRFHEYTDDAYVNGNMVQLMSQIPGTVTQINADDTQLVTEGQVLIKFDPADTDVALQRATASLAETVRQVRQLFENAERAKATLVWRKADFLKADLDLKRRAGLVGNSAVSKEEYQHYLTQKETAEAQYQIALHDVKSAEALVANTHIYTHPLVQTAIANFKIAYLNAARTTVLAPVTGYVAKRSVQVGQRVLVNTPMLAIVPLHEVWVDANYKESQLSDLRIGQPVTLYADAYSDVKYHGRVYGINAGTGAVFSLLPPQNATGNWIKIVQRLPVRILIDPEELKKYPLQLGLSMRVTTDIHDTRGSRLAQVAENKPLYSTRIYAEQIEKANETIDGILRDNSPDMFIAGTTDD